MTTPTPITDQRLDRRVRMLLTERAEEVAARAVPADAMADRVATDLRAPSEIRTWALLAAALLAALLVVGALAAGGAIPRPWLAHEPLPEGWTGPVRPDAPRR